MRPSSALALGLDPARILTALGITPDPWQRRVLMSNARASLLLCSRGAGKSRTTAAKALHRAIFHPNSLVLLLSRSQRQSLELFRYVKEGYRAIQRPVPLQKETETQLEFSNASRIICLPGKEETVRSYQGVALLVIDEGARVPDDLFKSVTPMLGMSGGQLMALSTPFGQRGWFHDAWMSDQTYERVKVTWEQCPRITAGWIENERARHGDPWIRQEYECSFESLSGLVYPDFWTLTRATEAPSCRGQLVGGIDFGFRNPFAAVWGYLDYDDILHLHGERYVRGAGLHEHAAALPRGATWFADPNHPTEINALVRAGLTVRKGKNSIQAGIAAVQARISTGRLRVSGCPNLIAEAKMYHYDPDREGENPVDSDNHALAALRYIVSRTDAAFVNMWLRKGEGDPGPAVRTPAAQPAPESAGSRFRRIMEAEEIWHG